MATAIRMCDGWDVTVSVMGKNKVVHFLTEPTEDQINDQIIIFEMLELENIAQNKVLENEENINGLHDQ